MLQKIKSSLNYFDNKLNVKKGFELRILGISLISMSFIIATNVAEPFDPIDSLLTIYALIAIGFVLLIYGMHRSHTSK